MGRILLALFGSAAVAGAQSPAEIERSIRELGSAEFRTREAAFARLRDCGAAALQPLQDSLATGNPEANRRAETLIAQIRLRLSDEAAIAPKFVSLSMPKAKLADVFDELRKQTTYEFRIVGESSLLAMETAFDTRGKVAVWQAVEMLCDAAGLEVGAVGSPQGPLNIAPVAVPQPTLTGEEAVLKEFREKKLVEMELKQARLGLQILKIESEMTKANARERAALAKDMAVLAAELKEATRKVAALKEILAAKPELPSPTGTITLQARTLAKPRSATSTGGIRMEVQPVSNRGTFTTAQVPVTVKFLPEPGVRWINVVDIVATKATDAAGRVLLHDHTPRPATTVSKTGSISGTYSGATTIKPSSEAAFALLAPPVGEMVSPLAVEGLVRANVWGTMETILTIHGIPSDGDAAADSGGDCSLGARFVPNPANTHAPYLEVVLSYNMARVKPRTTGLEQHDPPVWLGQGANGRAVLVKPAGKPQREMVRNEHGLSLTDDQGNPFVLNMNSAETTEFGSLDGSATHFQGRFRYTFRPVGTETPGTPSKLAFHGTRIKTITFPFALKDVPATAGTAAVPDPGDPVRW
jgi:hypothetical protein